MLQMSVDELDYEQIVVHYHESLYRFAYSLAGNPDDAAELTQETYVRLLNKSWQLRDRTRIKSWLFTTLYRTFLGWKRHQNRFPHVEVMSAEQELPPVTPKTADELDSETVMELVLTLDEHFRVPLALYYLQSHTYREIAELLDVSIGTVMSRLSRGKDLLRQRLKTQKSKSAPPANIITQDQPVKTMVQ